MTPGGKLFAILWPMLLAVCATSSVAPSSSGQNTSPAEIDVSATIRYTDSGVANKKTARTSTSELRRRAVLWLVPSDPSSTSPSSKAAYTLVQKGKEFHPDLLVVPVGSTVSFPNADPFFHNVFSLFNGKRFDLGLYQSGQTRTVDFNRAGVSYIFCNIHPEMTAVIISLRTPYYGSPGPAGLVVLHHVPEGSYTLEVWSELAAPEALTSLSRVVTISRTAVDLGSIDIPVSSPGIEKHLNKFGAPYDTHSADKPY